jgi:hypothetical protein
MQPPGTRIGGEDTFARAGMSQFRRVAACSR